MEMLDFGLIEEVATLKSNSKIIRVYQLSGCGLSANSVLSGLGSRLRYYD